LRLYSQYITTGGQEEAVLFFRLSWKSVNVQNKIGLNIAKRQRCLSSAGLVRILGLALILFLPACSLAPHISVVKDEPIEQLIRDEAERIISVTKDATNTSQYQNLIV
jgi:hypothetical protein